MTAPADPQGVPDRLRVAMDVAYILHRHGGVEPDVAAALALADPGDVKLLAKAIYRAAIADSLETLSGR